MFVRIAATVSACLTVLVAVAASANPAPIPAAPAVNATSWLIVEHNSGVTLGEKEPDRQVEPASITKLMTAYVVFRKLRDGQISLADQVLVSEKAWRTEGSRMWIEVDKKVGIEELLQGMIVQSGNDASIALAEHIAGSEDIFVAMMNQVATEIGLTGTHYVNSTGLPAEGHLTTARDIATLTRRVIEDFPEYYHWYSQKSYTYNEIQQYNRNSLLWRDETVDGLKTGHTDSAGYCLVASALRGDMRIVTVVLGTPSKDSRIDSSRKLLNHAFNHYETHLLYGAGKPITREKVWKGDVDATPLGLRDDLYVTIPRGRYEQLKASMKLPATLIAPLTTSDASGEVVVVLGDQTVAAAPLYSLEPVAEGGLLRRAVDEVRLWFE